MDPLVNNLTHTAHSQGLELALRAQNAAGAFTFGTMQADPRAEKTRLQPQRNADGQLTFPEDLERFIAGVRKLGAPRGIQTAGYVFSVVLKTMYRKLREPTCRRRLAFTPVGRSWTRPVPFGMHQAWLNLEK